MPRRKAWRGNPPETAEAARRILLEAARDCIERLGFQKAGLSDVAEAAGVTRQTVYRHFASTEELFHSAAALSRGGFHERLHERAMRRRSLAGRLVECLVFTIVEAPRDPHLATLAGGGMPITVGDALDLRFVQEEIVRLAQGPDTRPLTPRALDDLAELLLRLLHSFLTDPGAERDEAALRAFLLRVVEPVVARLHAPDN